MVPPRVENGESRLPTRQVEHDIRLSQVVILEGSLAAAAIPDELKMPGQEPKKVGPPQEFAQIKPAVSDEQRDHEENVHYHRRLKVSLPGNIQNQ